MLAAVISVPTREAVAGLRPSKPHWKGTANFNWPVAEPLSDSGTLVPEYLEPNSDASLFPVISSRDIVTLLPVPVLCGIGPRYCSLSSRTLSVIKSNPYKKIFFLSLKLFK